MDENLAESVWENMSGGSLIPVSDLGHLQLTSEAPSDTVINTMGLSPVWLKFAESWPEI